MALSIVRPAVKRCLFNELPVGEYFVTEYVSCFYKKISICSFIVISCIGDSFDVGYYEDGEKYFGDKPLDTIVVNHSEFRVTVTNNKTY